MRILNIKSNFDANELKNSGVYSFMNFASLSAFFKADKNKNLSYYCDGFLMCALVFVVTGNRVARVSFDFTSIAHDVFKYAESSKTKLAIIGATDEELYKFTSKIYSKYPNIEISFQRNGFFDEAEESNVLAQVISSEAKILIAGLGAGKQESFLKNCSSAGFNGVGYSCGGFIRQEAGSNSEYYPSLINRLHLRAFYRMYKEPHTIKRYVLSYPVNFVLFLYLFFSRKLKVVVS